MPFVYDELASGATYVESDPIGLWGGSYSTYSYVGANPVSKVDPRGLQEVLPTPEGPLVIPPTPGSTSSQWDQARDAEAIALQDAAENTVLALINATTKAAQTVHNLICGDSEEARCKQVVKTCREKCVDTYVDDPGSLPGTGSDMPGRIRRCIRECAESQGCHNF